MRTKRSHSMPGRPARHAGAFTIVELITVVTMVVIIIGSIYPVLLAMRNYNRLSAATNSITGAIAASRAAATRAMAPLDPPVTGAFYSGGGLIFTPSNEMRLVVNDQRAKDSNGNYLESKSPAQHGYKDLSGVDYLALPLGSAVAGITRTNSGSPNYLPPPFAIRFDQTGQLISGAASANADRYVYYPNVYYSSSNTNAVPPYQTGDPETYPVSSSRPGNYNPDPYDIEFTPTLTKVANGNVYPLPFFQLETVGGVVIYDKNEFHSWGGAWPSTPPRGYGTITAYLNARGKTYLVNRYTGSLLTP